MDTNLIISIVILVLVAAGFMSGKFKLGLVGMAGAVLLNLTGVLTQSEAFAYFSNGNLTMIAGMFVLSGAISKTSLVPAMRDLMIKHAGKYQIKDVLKVNLPLWIIYGVAVMFMANLLYPIGG